MMPRITLAILALLAGGAAKIDLFTPNQLPRGEATEVRIRIDQKATVERADVTPPQGVAVSDIKALDQKGQQGMKRWALTFTVDKDAAPGKRSVVVVTSQGETAPQEIEIPQHVPRLSDLKVTKAQRDPMELQFTVRVSDPEKDFGPGAEMQSTLICGGSIIGSIGSAQDVVAAGEGVSLVTLSLSQAGQRVLRPVVCDLELKLSDENKNTGRLKTQVEFK
jgi:hypothetical protein